MRVFSWDGDRGVLREGLTMKELQHIFKQRFHSLSYFNLWTKFFGEIFEMNT